MTVQVGLLILLTPLETALVALLIGALNIGGFDIDQIGNRLGDGGLVLALGSLFIKLKI